MEFLFERYTVVPIDHHVGEDSKGGKKKELPTDTVRW